MNCSLCTGKTILFSEVNSKRFYRCTICDAVLLDASFFLSLEAEKKRYLLHENDVNNINYQQFVSPITKAILTDFTTKNKGLDFGCGTGPVITKIVEDHGYSMTTYDPFFDNNKTALTKQYDFIVCCEVMEHFNNPAKEFELLKKLLKPNGKLYCMTKILSDSINFETWYYKNDPTHVVFYSKNTMQWIANYLGFSFWIEKNLVIFKNDSQYKNLL